MHRPSAWRTFGISCTPLVGILLVAGCSAAAIGGTAPLTNNLVIEGSISGLLGSGLVLQNNGAGDLTVNAPANNFLFTGISEKSSYSISIKTQPTAPTQTCTLSNGAGKIVFDPIRNVAIACTTNSFAVKGNVGGLTGAGLTLVLNGGAALPVSVGATSFGFPPIPSGTKYAVTIGTQPTGQTCSINGGSGTIGAADVITVTVACGGVGLTVSGTILGLGPNTGLSVRMNGGTPLPIGPNATSFAFPDVMQAGTDYSVTVASPASGPLRTCLLSNGKGRVGTSDITNLRLWCHANGGIDSYTGTYGILLNGRRNYVTLWFDGTYSAAYRIDDASCTNSGNGIEYGVYKRATNGTFNIQIALDNTGGCGLWFGGGTPGAGGGFEGTMVRNGNVLTLTSKTGETLVFGAVESVATSLVGSFTRADGEDGSFIVFEADGTYLFQDTQGSGGTNPIPAGVERGCYTVTGSSFTTSLAVSCRPDTFPALDQNGVGGFSGKNGAAIPFTITSATTATIGGVLYNRILPEG